MVPLLGFYSKDTAGQGHKDVQDRKTEGQKAVCPIIRAELETPKRPQWGLVNLLLSIWSFPYTYKHADVSCIRNPSPQLHAPK